MKIKYFMSSLGGENSSKDLPCQEGLSDEAESDVPPFAIEVVGPFALRLVLLPLHDCEAVEENEQRDNDAVDEAWHCGFGWAVGGEHVDGHGYPRHGTGNASEPEGEKVAIARGGVALLQPSKQDHAGVYSEDREKGNKVSNTIELQNDDDHYR